MLENGKGLGTGAGWWTGGGVGVKVFYEGGEMVKCGGGGGGVGVKVLRKRGDGEVWGWCGCEGVIKEGRCHI